MMLYFENCATVQDVMSLKQEECPDHSDVLCIPTSATLQQAISYMADHGVGAVFVRNSEQEITGILSERDIILHIARLGLDAFETNLQKLARTEIVSCKPEDKLKTVTAEMADLNIRHIAVKNDQNDVVGVISASDVELFAGKG